MIQGRRSHRGKGGDRPPPKFFKDFIGSFDQNIFQEGKLPRQRRHPSRLTECLGYSAEGDQNFDNIKDMYRSKYFEAYDFVMNAIRDRFDQPDYQMYACMQDILLTAAKGGDVSDYMTKVIGENTFTALYEDDIDMESLRQQLRLLPSILKLESSDVTISNILTKIRGMSPSKRCLVDQVIELVILILLAPATNAESERCFSAMKRVKNYLRATMGQPRFKNLMTLYIHKEKLDDINLVKVLNTFVSKSRDRYAVFGQFTEADIIQLKGAATREFATQTDTRM